MDFTKQTCEEFIEILASKEPVPGGGGAAALVGAIGMALGNMVGSLTLGKKKYASVQDEIHEIKKRADDLQKELIFLMQRDAEVFVPLSRAYKMPKDTEEQKAKKSRVIAAALKECCDIPLEIMKKCCEAIDLHEEFATKGTLMAISDAGCGVICCKAALQAASLNVFINTKSMEDHIMAGKYNQKANSMLDIYTAKADRIFDSVAASLK